jgi:N-methylhydantoinase A/oxoprolinase/acetone carboxylase beta subunit
VAEKLGMAPAYAFNLGPVFSAFGSAISDVVHSYERGIDQKWDVTSHKALTPLISTLNTQADRDLRGEGFDPAQARFTWEIDFGSTDADVVTVRAEMGATDDAEVAVALKAAVEQSFQNGNGMLALRLSTRFVVGAHGMSKRSDRVSAQPVGQRDARFSAGARQSVAVHRWEGMNVGDVVDGPAIVNGATLTCPVPAGWRLEVDEYGNARMQPI